MNYMSLDHLTTEYEEAVWNLLKNADHEFVPPLSAREGTTQKNLTPTSENAGPSGTASAAAAKIEPRSYFEQMKQQAYILAEEGGAIFGFLTYIPKRTLSLSTGTFVCEYVSTIVVDPAYRRRGITKGMYRALFEEKPDAIVATRTWSQNGAHLKVLSELNFELAETLKDDRGPGIDTVYYKREGRK